MARLHPGPLAGVPGQRQCRRKQSSGKSWVRGQRRPKRRATRMTLPHGASKQSPASRTMINRARDDARRPVWLEATECFYKKLNRIAKQCNFSRYQALSRGLDALLREAEVRNSAL